MASVDAGGVERFSDDRLVVELLCVTPHAGEGGLAVALEISLFGGDHGAAQHLPVFGARAGPAQQLREPAISEVGIGAAIVEIELDRRVHQPLPLSSKTELC